MGKTQNPTDKEAAGMEEQGKEHRVRIYDIAEELGLSTATVSNVIHGKTKKISDKTVKRVMALLEKRQYFPGVADILLAQNDSRIIGVFVNDHEKYEGHTLEDFFYFFFHQLSFHRNRKQRPVHDNKKSKTG